MKVGSTAYDPGRWRRPAGTRNTARRPRGWSTKLPRARTAPRSRAWSIPRRRDYVFATQGGFYPTQNFLVAAGDLPFFDPGVARVPGLILFGENDIVVGPDGVDHLALDYGADGATLISRPDAGHAPRTGSPEIAAWYWDNLFAFLDPPF